MTLRETPYSGYMVKDVSAMQISDSAGELLTSPTSLSGADGKEYEVKGDIKITYTNKKGVIPVILKNVGVTNTDQSQVQTILGGAKFSVYNATGDQLDQKGDEVVVDNGDESQRLTNLVSNDTTGVFWSGQLPPGTYLIEEDEAPNGYNNIGVLVKMTISNDSVTLSHIGTTGSPQQIYNEPVKDRETWVVTLINTAGISLPSTGGPGTTLIYLLGALMLLISGSWMVLYRRRRIRSDASFEQ